MHEGLALESNYILRKVWFFFIEVEKWYSFCKIHLSEEWNCKGHNVYGWWSTVALVAGATCHDGKGIQSALGKLHWLLDLPIFSQTVQWPSWACTCSHESEWPHKGIAWWTVHILGWNSACILWCPNCMLPFLKPILQICHLFCLWKCWILWGVWR
jgi:hypothetical protein